MKPQRSLCLTVRCYICFLSLHNKRMTTKQHTVNNNLKQNTFIILDFGRSEVWAQCSWSSPGWNQGLARWGFPLEIRVLIQAHGGKNVISYSCRTEVHVFLSAIGLRMVSAPRGHPQVLHTWPPPWAVHNRAVCFLPGQQEYVCYCFLSVLRAQLIGSGSPRIISILIYHSIRNLSYTCKIPSAV